jgi:hypothetical protein
MTKFSIAPFCSALALMVIADSSAQSAPVLPPIPNDVSAPAIPRMESCDEVNCDVSTAQIKAFDKARQLYAQDRMAAQTYSVVFGQENGNIAITFIPSPLGTRGRAVTYLFDSAGSTMKRSYVNR